MLQSDLAWTNFQALSASFLQLLANLNLRFWLPWTLSSERNRANLDLAQNQQNRLLVRKVLFIGGR